MRQIDDFYVCPVCQEPINYDPSGDPCQKCEYYEEELHRDEERKYERMMEERERWLEEYGREE